jgi:hypothetical protein
VALKLNNNYLVTPNYTLNNLQATVSLVPPPVKACPPSAPLFNGTECVACASNYYYNSTNNLCQPLPNYYPNLNSQGWIVDNTSSLKLLISNTNALKKVKGAIICPSSAPDYNFNTNLCGNCPTGQYWNYNNYTCMACPTNYSVDPNTRTCLLPLVGTYQTNLTAQHLLFNGISIAQYNYIQSQQKLKYPNIQSCPLSAPFFDGYKCIACKNPYPLFSMLHRTCAACPIGTVYSVSSSDCVGVNGGLATSPPNLGKMYSSIF